MPDRYWRRQRCWLKRRRETADYTRGVHGLKASKAYIAGLGTTGILLASSALLMVVVGAVVAFNGVSVSQGLRELEGLVVDRDEPVGLSGPALAAAEAAPASRGVSSRPPASVSAGATAVGAGAAGAGAGGAGGSGAAPGGSSGPGGGSGGPVAGTPQQGGAGGGGVQTPERRRVDGGHAPALPGGGGGGQSLGQTTQGVTDGVGNVVDSVDPRLGDTVRGLGETTGEPGRRPDRRALGPQLLEHEAPRQVLHLQVVLERAVVPARDDHQPLGLVRGRVQLLADRVGDPLVSTRV